ncbi:MAG: hypothetical protein AAF447_02245 [Myxococcota bacterium]
MTTDDAISAPVLAALIVLLSMGPLALLWALPAAPLAVPCLPALVLAVASLVFRRWRGWSDGALRYVLFAAAWSVMLAAFVVVLAVLRAQ